MNDVSSLQHSARAFEQRIMDVFQVIGYGVERPREPSDFDFLVHRYEFPFEIRALVELKYFERSLVPASVVYKYLDVAQRHSFDKAIIVTTLGFTQEAIELSERSRGKIVLLTEMELLEKLPRKRLGEYYDSFFESNYVHFSLQDYYEENRLSYQNLISKIPRDKLCELLSKIASSEDVANFVAEKVPRDRVIEQFQRTLEPSEIKDILRLHPKRAEVSYSKKQEIEQTYNKARTSNDPNQKGKLFEEVLKEIFKLVPGLKIVGSNVNDGMEEIDIQLRNYNREHIWSEFEGMIFVECKNWSKPVGSDEIDHFEGKLDRNGLHSGILVAVMGVTGSHIRLEGAWGTVKMCLQKGRRIVVLDGKDLEDILKCADISQKVDEKYVRLYKLGSPN